MKYLLATLLMSVATPVFAEAPWDCGRNSVIFYWGTCDKGAGTHNSPRGASHTPGTPSKPDTNVPGGNPIAGNPNKPSTPTTVGTTPTTPGTPGVPGTPGGKTKHNNNGFGNGDQDAPGNSLSHNNAENAQGGRHGKGKNSK